MEDTQIIDLFWKREERAVTELSDKYSGYCYKIAWNLLENHEDSEECLSSTWYAAWNAMPPHRPSVLSAFLGRITRRQAIDLFRKKRAARRPDAHIADLCDELEELNGVYSVDEEIARKELMQVIEQFLKKLSETDRDIFIRRYWYLDPVREIAKRHKVSEGCIKTNLCRNRKKLQRILQKEGFR